MVRDSGMVLIFTFPTDGLPERKTSQAQATGGAGSEDPMVVHEFARAANPSGRGVGDARAR
jgi:hypothetical protein